MEVVKNGKDKYREVVCCYCDSTIAYKNGEVQVEEEEYEREEFSCYERYGFLRLRKRAVYETVKYKREIMYITCPVCGARKILNITAFRNGDIFLT